VKIVIPGTGYVGPLNGVLLAHRNKVVCLDIVAEKVAMHNLEESAIETPRSKASSSTSLRAWYSFLTALRHPTPIGTGSGYQSSSFQGLQHWQQWLGTIRELHCCT
jgi:UDP-glucose/GDP-mannose dehydrogenase family, NAD binding domain